MTTLYLIRHAEAEGNVYRRIDGHYNSLITPNGLRQIETLRERFAEISIDACYASDLYRTCKTATAIYVPKGLALQKDARLREVGLGRWENHPFGELETFEPEGLHQFNHDIANWHVEGSETRGQIVERFEMALREIAERHAGQTAAVFTHGCVLRCFQEILLCGAGVPYCDNTAVSKLRYADGTFEIEFLNDASHLTPEISTFARQKWWRESGGNGDFNMWYRESAPGCFTAMLGEAAVGTVRVELRSAVEGEIVELELVKERRGKRLGEQLIGCAVCALREKGAERVLVQLPAKATAAGFFEHFGFERVAPGMIAREIRVPEIG